MFFRPHNSSSRDGGSPALRRFLSNLTKAKFRPYGVGVVATTKGEDVPCVIASALQDSSYPGTIAKCNQSREG
jgi:hypothetical protein